MSSRRLPDRVVLILPLVALVLTFSLVYGQYARRDRLKSELAVTEREYSTLIKQFQALHAQIASGRPEHPGKG
jgi:hypothetical protein